MIISPVKSTAATAECKTMLWNNDMETNNKRYNELKPTYDNSPDESCDYMMIRTSLCWTETCSRSLKITESHKASGISVSSFIKFGKPHTSVSDFV